MEILKLRCFRQSKLCGKAVFQMDSHEYKCVVYFAKVSWKGGPTVQPSLLAEGVMQTRN